MDETITLRERGTITLPSSVRERHHLQPGDAFRLLDLGGIFVLTPLVPMVPDLAREIERLRLEAGVTSADLLAGLREQRSRYDAGRRGE